MRAISSVTLAVVAALLVSTMGGTDAHAKDNAGGGGGCFGCQEALGASWCVIYGRGPGTLFGMTECDTMYNFSNDSTYCVRHGALCLGPAGWPSSPGYL